MFTPTAPLTHGMGTEGNRQVLLRRTFLLGDADEAGPTEVPAVSGAALKATLREWAVRDYLERAGIPEGGVSRDALRLLLKGGRNDAGGQTVSLAETRRLRTLCPALAVFGSMDGGLPIAGAVQVSDVLPWCQELVDADILPRRIVPLSVDVDGRALVEGAVVEVYPDRAPVALHDVAGSVTYYRHDLLGGPLTHYLAAPEIEATEDARAAVATARRTKGAPKPDAEQRREANESMPHEQETIRAGTPLVATLRLRAASDIEFAAFGLAVVRWIASGAHLGGGSTKGHGACRVRVAGALRHDPPSGVAPVAPAEPLPALSVAFDASAPARAYADHIAARAAEIRAWVAEATR